MSVQFEKKLKKAITILENDGASKTSSPKRNREGFAEAINSIKKVLADEQYWSKIYGNRAINCAFNILEVDDGSLRLLADQCLNAIFRKFILKSQPSRALIALLNELSKNGGSARGFAAALSMLPIVLKHGREHRMQVYAMHFLHALRESLKRPEQAVHSAIETFASDLIRFFRSDYVDAHEPYANRLMIQCLENLTLSGMYSNRAAASVLASVSENIPGMMSLVCGRIIGLLAIVEEGKHKNETVGLLNTLKKMWPALVDDQPKMAIRQATLLTIVVKVLSCLNSTLSEIESATLELLQLIVLKTPFILLDFQPHLFKAECSSEDERKSSSQLFEMDPLADLNESFISRSSSISSLVESEANTSRADSLVADENGSDTDEMSNRSGESTPKNRESYIEMDPLFQTQTDSPIAEYLLDKQFENELVVSGAPIKEEVKGFLCARLPICSCPPNADFYFYSATLVAEKFLLTGKLGEIRPDSEVRTSLKILALKYLAAVGTVYENLTNVTVCVDGTYRQPLSDLHQLLSSSDEGISMAVFNLFASLENTYHSKGQKFPSTFYSTGRFLTITATLLQNSNPRRLKEIFQILADNIDLVMGDEHLFTAVCDAAIGSVDCDYFLLKIARAELFAKIRWNCLSPQMISAYQSLCLTHFCRQCFDSDFRVVSATMNNFKSLVENAEFGFISNVFNVYWNDNLFLPSFNAFSQVFALHPNYSFRGESPDLSLEENLSEILETLTEEYAKKAGERTAGYVNALLVLARSYPPVIFSGAWGCLKGQNQSHPLIGMLIEIAESSTTTLSQLVHILKLIGLVFSGVVENAFIKGANRAEFNKNIAYLEGQQTLDKIVILYLRLMNLYYTIIKESTTVASTTASLTSPLFPKISWPSGSEQENSPVYNISNLTNTGIRPYKSKTSFLNSSSLCLLEPVIRGSFNNFMSSMKTDVEERIVAPLEAALDGFCCLIEVLPRELLTSFIDELFLYLRTCTNLALRPITSTLTQMLKCLFGQNALNINANLIVLLKSRHSISPIDQLEMLIGRSINNYSVHVAFLDRFEQMDLHRLKHFGYLSNKSSVNLAREQIKQPIEISTYLEQFEKSVTYLLHAYLNISDVEARCAVLKLICVLVLNDVRYDKLDPNNRVLNSVLATARHERFKNGESIGMLFTFLCTVSRSVDSLSFDEVVELACKCMERVNYTSREDVDIVLNAVHVVLAESISFYSTMPKKLIDALSKENLFEKSPAKVIELWTAVIHWSRSTDRLWQEMSTNFVDALFVFVAKLDVKFNNDNYKERLDLAHALSIALKTCNPIVFRPINQLFTTFLDVSTRDLFLCIPFTLALFCRLDQEEILMQLFEADSNSLKLVGRNLATLVLRETTSLIRNVKKAHMNSLEDSISFFGIMLFHILRSETARSASFSAMLVESFRSTIEESNEFDNLKASLTSIAHLHPKIYAVWLLLLFQLELFDEPSKMIFSPNLPHHAKQLIALLFLQRLCDERLQINEAILKLLNSAPDEFLVRLLKLARPKQLASIKKRMPISVLESLIEKARTYLSAHPMTGAFDSITELTDKADLFQTDNLPYLYNSVQSWILSGKVQALDNKQPNEPKTYLEICQFLMKTATGFDDITCLANLSLHLDRESLEALINSMEPNWRPLFFTTFFNLLNREIRDIKNNAYLLSQEPNFTAAMNLCQIFTDLIDKSTNYTSSDYCSILLGLQKLPHEIGCFDQIQINSIDKILNVCFIKQLMEAEIANAEIDCDFFDALAELFRRGQLHKIYINDYQAVENLCLFLRLILDNVERDLPKTQRFKINRNHWNVDLVAGCKDAERLKDEIYESFSLVQRAAYLFLNSNTSPLIKSAKYAVLPILRLPVFSRMFVVPKVALNRDWKLDIVGQADKIKVALIPIHMLNEPDIIADFVRRILYSGWTSKSQYETWFVTLLGVLCSTPIENLDDEDVQKITDQIAASAIAVDALTSMLTQSLLVPNSGDTTNSRFVIKHRQNRDSYLFLQSTNGKYAAISRTQIEGGFEPEMVFVQNIERDQFSRKFYSFGQKSVSTLWSMFSEMDKSPTKDSPNRSPNIKLDSFSSLKALFENYFHWCKSDLNNLPLPLLTSTLRSMAILSDMFNDAELYTSVYAEMRKLLDQQTNTDHPIYGYAIYNLLKCLAVLDLEKLTVNRAEICRLVDTCVQSGLKSTSNFVVFATLHGVLYLIQSVNTDDFNATLALVFNFLLEEFQRLNNKIDILNSSDAEPVAYHRLLFTVAFRLALHISVDPNPVVKFVSLIRSLFVDPRLPEWLRSSLASGIQTLIMHNASYAETSFRETVVELFDTFQLRPLGFPHALCIYMTSVYRTTQNDKPSSSKQLENFRSDLQKLLNVFSFYTTRKHMERFLPTIAHLMLTLLKMDQIFEMLLSMIPIRATRNARHISNYDRSMLYLLFYVLRDAYTHTQQEIVSFALKSVFPKVPISDQSSLLMIITNLLVMSALSSDKQTNSLVHVLLRQTQPNAMLLRSCYSQLIASFKKSAERCGFTLDQRDFPMEPIFDLENDGSL